MKLRISLPDKDPFEVEVPGDQVTVGRSPECDVVVANPYVSKVHVCLYRGLVAQDLGSINGTFFVGGEQLEGSGLVTDGRITIGQDNVVIEVLEESPEQGEEVELRELQGKTAGLEHELEEIRNENAYLRLQLESMRKAEATRSAVQELSKAQLMKQGMDLDEFERLQSSYTEVLERLQSDIEARMRDRETRY